jgi:hypothetical protein
MKKLSCSGISALPPNRGVSLCLEDIDWRAGTLVRDKRLGANIKLQFDIVSFFDIDFKRPGEVLADQCAGCASRLDRGVEILIHN